MNLARFIGDRTSAWRELDELATRGRRRPERLGAGGVRRLGALYRSTAADLAFARRSFPGDPVVIALEQRVGRARHLVYRAPTRRDSVLAFIRRDYWRAVRERPVPLLIAVVLLVGTAGISGVWADRDPGQAATLAPGSYQAVTHRRPHGSNLELPRSVRSGLAGTIFTNNIRVSLLVLAAGVAAGIGSAILLIYNALQLGVVGGLAFGSGNGRVFVELVAAHGMLELSCIVVAAAAGMRLGWALIDPGGKTRAAAMGAEARKAVAIVIGTAPWLVVAGLVEGFLTPAGLSLTEALTLGGALAATYWTLVLVLGRPRPAPATSP